MRESESSMMVVVTLAPLYISAGLHVALCHACPCHPWKVCSLLGDRHLNHHVIHIEPQPPIPILGRVLFFDCRPAGSVEDALPVSFPLTQLYST